MRAPRERVTNRNFYAGKLFSDILKSYRHFSSFLSPVRANGSSFIQRSVAVTQVGQTNSFHRCKRTIPGDNCTREQKCVAIKLEKCVNKSLFTDTIPAFFPSPTFVAPPDPIPICAGLRFICPTRCYDQQIKLRWNSTRCSAVKLSWF